MVDKKQFDIDQRPKALLQPEPSVSIGPIARRRRYSHTFSAGRHLKLIRSASGKMRWRRVPDGAIVHFGKQYSHRKSADIGSTTSNVVSSKSNIQSY